MVGDYFSKPVQGQKFRTFRKQILDHRSINCTDPPQECVGEEMKETKRADEQNTKENERNMQ
eukprot:10303464-Ditylum_brightwellii.AAC.1